MSEKTLYKVGTDASIIFLLFVLSAVPVMAVESAHKNEPQPWVDRNNFPEAYSILTSDHIMFPDNTTDWPLKIDSKRQLFIDDYMLSSMKNLTRQFHQATKHPDNPLIVSDRPWELESPEWMCMGDSLYNPITKKFQMWYLIESNPQSEGGSTFLHNDPVRKTKYRMVYAESDDGITWRRPNLGLVEYKGSTDNNILPARPYQILSFNPYAPNPQDRYKAVVDGYLGKSSDGIRWTYDTRYPILNHTSNSMSPGPYYSYGIGDTTQYRYDPILERYICDAKFNLYFPQEKMDQLGIITDKPRLKLRTFSESKDFIHWTRPRFYLYPDRNDPPDCQMYSHIGFNYESMWVGMLRVMHMISTSWKQVDVQMTYSRDGRHWSRPRKRQPLIPLGGPDSWDPDYTNPSRNGPFLYDNEIYFYYRGCRYRKRDDPNATAARPALLYKMAIGLAKLRRDGFASLNAGQTAGKVITRPMTFAGKKLFVNADVEKGGWVKAAVLTRDSKPVESYTLDDSLALTKDTTKGQMKWKSKKELAAPGDGHLRLVFQLKNAKLYSFWIE